MYNQELDQDKVPYPSAPLHQQPTSTMSNTNTAVVIQQQPAAIVVQGARGWSSGVCACFDDCGVCKPGGGGTGCEEQGCDGVGLSSFERCEQMN